MAEALVAFLWHFHQPLYLEPDTNRTALPWVRLHATKGYTDLVALLDEYPHVRTTINVVPSLLDQIEAAGSGTLDDPALDLMHRPADGLSADEARLLLRLAFQVNWTTQVHPVHRYRELLEKRGTRGNNDGIPDRVLARFTAQDLLDLQVWSTLAWMGFTLRQREPLVAAALDKGRDFTEDEKQALLATQADAVKAVIPRLKAAQDRGQVELTTSPYFHPILPLLMNTDFARRALPDATLPSVPFVAPEDARAQLRMAVASHRSHFGRPPRGCWPSEGSVCPELLKVLEDSGFTWCASDEAILTDSGRVSDPAPGITQPYTAVSKDGAITMVFRDRELSDRIGFTYAANSGAEAADDFLARARHIAAEAPRSPALVPVILDGENPWEYYPDGGEAFLRTLYEAAEREADIRFLSMEDAIEAAGPGPDIFALHSGSWINSDYGVWADGPAESAAWDALRHTREFLVRTQAEQPDLGTDRFENAWRHLYAAEGSDWFWWCGENFQSDNDAEFDRLFRLHLEAVYRACRAEPPADLHTSRLLEPDRPGWRGPCAFIHPIVDGRMTDYYEWTGAGHADVTAGRALHIERGALRSLHFGFDEAHLYLRADGGFPIRNRDGTTAELQWLLEGAHAWRLRCSAGPAPVLCVESALDHAGFELRHTLDTIALEDIMELAVPWALLDAPPGTVYGLSLRVFRDGLISERLPHDGAIPLTVPSAAFEAEGWIV